MPLRFLPYQANAFGDVAIASDGINGSTTRHAMRLINSRFAKQILLG
jgi:cytochrome c peroxidase